MILDKIEAFTRELQNLLTDFNADYLAIQEDHLDIRQTLCDLSNKVIENGKKIDKLNDNKEKIAEKLTECLDFFVSCSQEYPPLEKGEYSQKASHIPFREINTSTSSGDSKSKINDPLTSQEEKVITKGPQQLPVSIDKLLEKFTSGKGATESSTQTSLSKGPLEQPTVISEFQENKKVPIGDLKSPKGIIATHHVRTNLHPMEKEYYEFSEWVYNFREGSSLYLTALPTAIYPRISAVQGADPNIVRKLAAFGFLDRLFPGIDLKEIEQFDKEFVNCVKKFSDKQPIELRFYTISPEYKEPEWYGEHHLVTIRKNNGNPLKEIQIFKELPTINKKWMIYRRALGIKSVCSTMQFFYGERYMVYGMSNNWILICRGDKESKILEEKICGIMNDQFSGSEECIKEACRLMGHVHK